MPIIDVMFTQGALDKAQQATLSMRLSDILMEIEGTKGNPQFESGTWLTLQETGQSHFTVGGRPGIYSSCYRIVVHVPEKALPLEAKEAIVSRMTDAVLETEGCPLELAQRLRVYCVINEIADGGWGFAGTVYTRERLQALRA